MSILLKIVVTTLFTGLATVITRLATVDNKTAQRMCAAILVICGIVIFSCLIYLMWQL